MTHVFSPSFTSQTKAVWNRLLSDQPLNGDPQPTLYMNPTTAVRLQGYRIAFPGYLPWNPGSAIPFGGPQSLLQLYQDFNLVKGRHDLRFGGSYTHIKDERTFGAYENAVEDLNTTSDRPPLARQLRQRPASGGSRRPSTPAATRAAPTRPR